jgi:hypothetical protein
VRVGLDVQLHTARTKLKVDVNVGDPIWPEPQQVAVPRLLVDESIVLAGYPLHMVHAEKLVTAVARGTANTRWRDFADIYLLSRRHDLDGGDLQQAIAVVAQHRRAQIRPLSDVLRGYAALGQPKWAAWRTRHQLDDRLPGDFAEVIDDVTTFADPALRQSTAGRIWRARLRVWHPDDAPEGNSRRW